MTDEVNAVPHRFRPPPLRLHPFPLPPAGAPAYNLALSNLPTQTARAYTIANMRRRTLLLAAGLLAYFAGATVRVYLSPEELCSLRDAGCRVRAAVEHPRAVLEHPLLAIDFLVTDEPDYSE